jgi:hypothetical protein
MTAERKETVFKAGIQKTVRRRLSNRVSNDARDLCVATLILIESMKLRLSEMMKPDYFEPKATEEGDRKKEQLDRPKWGAQQLNAVDPYILALQQERASATGAAGAEGDAIWCPKPRCGMVTENC